MVLLPGRTEGLNRNGLIMEKSEYVKLQESDEVREIKSRLTGRQYIVIPGRGDIVYVGNRSTLNPCVFKDEIRYIQKRIGDYEYINVYIEGLGGIIDFFDEIIHFQKPFNIENQPIDESEEVYLMCSNMIYCREVKE